MKVIVNKEGKELSFDFNGKTYTFATTKEGFKVEDDLYNHLKEIVPLAFNFSPKDKNLAVIEPNIVVTQNKFTGATFGVQSKKFENNPDETPANGKTDKDGVEWYGDGLQDDTA